MPDGSHIPAQPDPRIARTEDILRDFGELRHLAMNIARAKSAQACRESAQTEESEAAEDSDAPSRRPGGRDPVEAFNAVSRNLRIIGALELRVADYLAALRAGDPSAAFWPSRWRSNPRAPNPREVDPSKPEPDRMDERDTLRGNILQLLQPETFGEDECDRIYRELDERLFETERYDDFLDLPMQKAVDAICKDLGIDIDWEPWERRVWPPWVEKKRAPEAPPPGDAAAPPREDGVAAEGGAPSPPPESLAIDDHPYPDSG